MPLAPGTRLGSYTIAMSIGAGGMGEVYRATDNNLGRDVAIKVLPEAFAQDAERLARFEREAKTLASLNHPNIAVVHGFEKGDGVRALVMELVEGPTLADRIAQGALPVDEAMAIAKQIAEALEAAHEQGIVHRDLKPANVKVRDDGTVKVLDFGLAKMVEGPAEAGHYVQSTATMSPTITTPAMTQLGMILGTAAYMAPEQARGKAVDKRSDIWAFGCVLFEMLSGRRAFDGEDVTDTIAAVVRAEPEWETLPADLPTSIRLLLRRCLEKDRKKRIGDMAAALFVMRDTDALSAGPTSAIASSPRRYPATDALYRIDAGAQPVWSQSGMELFYARATQLLVTTLTTSPSFANSVPSALPTIRAASFFRNYDVSADGTRILAVVPALSANAGDSTRPRIEVVLNWSEELKRLLPAD